MTLIPKEIRSPINIPDAKARHKMMSGSKPANVPISVATHAVISPITVAQDPFRLILRRKICCFNDIVFSVGSVVE